MPSVSIAMSRPIGSVILRVGVGVPLSKIRRTPLAEKPGEPAIANVLSEETATD